MTQQAALGLPAYLYLFDHGYPSADAAATDETALSEAMLDYWSSFARNAEPRAAHEPDWPCMRCTKRLSAGAGRMAGWHGTGMSASFRRRYPLSARTAGSALIAIQREQQQ